MQVEMSLDIREVSPCVASKQEKTTGSMCSHTFGHRDPSAIALQNPIGSDTSRASRHALR